MTERIKAHCTPPASATCASSFSRIASRGLWLSGIQSWEGMRDTAEATRHGSDLLRILTENGDAIKGAMRETTLGIYAFLRDRVVAVQDSRFL